MMCRDLITFINQGFKYCDDSQSFRRLVDLEYECCQGCLTGARGKIWNAHLVS